MEREAYDGKRTLRERTSGKTWQIERQGCELLMSSGTGKGRIKAFPDEEQARRQAEKKIWTRLKNGFVYLDEQADPGRPVLHLYRGAGYTGFMPLAVSTDCNDCYTAYVVGQFESTEIRRYNERGEEQMTFILPDQRMVYAMKWNKRQGHILLNDSHQIKLLDLNSGGEQSLSGSHMPNDLDLAGGRTVWRERDEALVMDCASQQVLRRLPVSPEMYGGHSPQFAAALSPDGERLALCDQLARLVVYDVNDGDKAVIHKTRDEDLCQQLAFSRDGQFLYSLGVYAQPNLIAYDLNVPDEAHQAWQLEDVRDLAVDAVRGWLAVHRYKQVEIYEQRSHQLFMRFPLEHVVKRVEMAFTRDYLAVYSDYGCISMYKLP